MRILEAKDMEVYKTLLRVLAEYAKANPGSGALRLFNNVVGNSKASVMPKDKLAIQILDNVLDCTVPAASFQKLMNMRFCNLPMCCRPLVKKGRRHETACWTRGDHIFDRVKDLIDWEGSGKGGRWCTLEGDAADLVDMAPMEEAKKCTTAQKRSGETAGHLAKSIRWEMCQTDQMDLPELEEFYASVRTDPSFSKDDRSAIWQELKQKRREAKESRSIREEKTYLLHGKEYLPYSLYDPKKRDEVLQYFRSKDIRAVRDPKLPHVVMIPVKNRGEADDYFGVREK